MSGQSNDGGNRTGKTERSKAIFWYNVEDQQVEKCPSILSGIVMHFFAALHPLLWPDFSISIHVPHTKELTSLL